MIRTRSSSCFVRVKWQKMTYNDVEVVLQDDPVKLKILLETLTAVPVKSQKLSCAGKIIKDNASLYVAVLYIAICCITPFAYWIQE